METVDVASLIKWSKQCGWTRDTWHYVRPEWWNMKRPAPPVMRSYQEKEFSLNLWIIGTQLKTPYFDYTYHPVDYTLRIKKWKI